MACLTHYDDSDTGAPVLNASTAARLFAEKHRRPPGVVLVSPHDDGIGPVHGIPVRDRPWVARGLYIACDDDTEGAPQ